MLELACFKIGNQLAHKHKILLKKSVWEQIYLR